MTKFCPFHYERAVLLAKIVLYLLGVFDARGASLTPYVASMNVVHTEWVLPSALWEDFITKLVNN